MIDGLQIANGTLRRIQDGANISERELVALARERSAILRGEGGYIYLLDTLPRVTKRIKIGFSTDVINRIHDQRTLLPTASLIWVFRAWRQWEGIFRNLIKGQAGCYEINGPKRRRSEVIYVTDLAALIAFAIEFENHTGWMWGESFRGRKNKPIGE